MYNETPVLAMLLFFALLSMALSIKLFVSWIRGLIRTKKDAEQNLAVADDYVQDLQNEKEELASGYSIMATTIEGLQTEIEALTSHMAEHCQQIHALQTRGIRIVINPMSMSQDYTGPDECNEEPYSESTAPTLPLPTLDWVENVEGLDEL